MPAMQTLDALSLNVDETTLQRALGWLEALGRRRQWPARTQFALTLCLDEALTNIVMHGQPQDGHACIELCAQQDLNTVVLTISDNGPAFDPTLATPPELATSIEQARMGGHGVRLMRHYLKDIQYTRHNQRNHLRLTAALNEGQP